MKNQDIEEELHEQAREFMYELEKKFDVKAMSLDEFLCEYSEVLPQDILDEGYKILSEFDKL